MSQKRGKSAAYVEKTPQNNGSAVYENLAYFSSKIEAPFVKSVSVSTFGHRCHDSVSLIFIVFLSINLDKMDDFTLVFDLLDYKNLHLAKKLNIVNLATLH